MTDEKKPQIIGVIREMELVGSRFDIASCTYGQVVDKETYTCDPTYEVPGSIRLAENPLAVTESMVFVDGVVCTTEVDLKSPLKRFEVRFVLPDTMKFADEVKVLLRRPRKKALPRRPKNK